MAVKTIEIHGANAHRMYTKMRVGCRGVVVQDSRILLSHEVKTDLYVLPGGGLEEHETAEDGCAREICEETGYIVKPVSHFLTIHEYYQEYKFVSHYFRCECTGKSEPHLTASEMERGLIPEWMDLQKIVLLYSKYNDFSAVNDEKRSLYLREYTALSEYVRQFASDEASPETCPHTAYGLGDDPV